MSILINNKEINSLFPNGEVKINTEWLDTLTPNSNIEALYQYNPDTVSDDVLTLIFLSRYVGLKSQRYPNTKLVVNAPYLPFTRMDRETGNQMDTLRIFLTLLPCEIITREIHNKEAEGIKKHYAPIKEELTSYDLLKHHIKETWEAKSSPYVLLFPDKGAYNKYVKNQGINEVMQSFTFYDYDIVHTPIIFIGHKTRCPLTGKLTYESIEPLIPEQKRLVTDEMRVVILDDLCEGGRTFDLCIKAFQQVFPDTVFFVELVVTHLSPKGWEEGERFNNFIDIDRIVTTDSMLQHSKIQSPNVSIYTIDEL